MNRAAFPGGLFRAADVAATLSRPSQGHLLTTKIRCSSSLPTIAQPSFWKSLVPKPLRREKLPPDAAALRKPRSKGWNPATFFIIMFMFVGSMSIQMIKLKKDFATFTRQSDVRIGILREVMEKIQRGEKVDVERVLGTGDAEKEREWEEALREIERDETWRNQKKQEKNLGEAASSKKAQSSTRTEAPQPQVKTGSSASFF